MARPVPPRAGLDPNAPSFSLSDAPRGSGEPEGLVFTSAMGEARFELGGTVGRGGMGWVRVARDRVLGREVAVKELDPTLRGDPGAARRMACEARLTALLDHPGVVAVHDAGHLKDGRPFYAMRLVRGRTLAAALEEAKDAESRLALLRHLLAACEAVAVAHAAGVVHRDLKPANLLIGSFGETQVIDWGLAALTPSAYARWPELASLGAASDVGGGTPAWMAPEQAAGAPPEPTADVWSLGAVLHALLTGAPPRPGSAPPTSPPELAAVVARATDPDPAKRYPDAGALAAELLRWFEGRRVEAYSYSSMDLLRRLARAWRVPLFVGLVGLLALGTSILVGVLRVGSQRDRAVEAEQQAVAAREETERALARSLAREAEDAGLASVRSEAELFAARALRLMDSPEARGVLASFGLQPRPRLLSREAGPECAWADLSEDGDLLLCGEDGGTSAWTGSPPRRAWRSPLAASGGEALADGGARVWQGWQRAWKLDENGAIDVAYPQRTGALGGHWIPAFGAPLIFARGAPWPDGGHLPPPSCGDTKPRVVVAAADGEGLLTACADGALLLGTPDRPARRRLSTPYKDDVEVTALTWDQARERALIGTLRDKVALVDLRDGRVVASVDTGLGLITRLALSPDGQMVAISGRAEGVGLWDIGRGLWLGTLPAGRNAHMAWVGGVLRVFDGRWSDWAPPTGGTPWRVGVGGGLSDAEPSPDGRALALATGDGRVIRVDLGTGRWETVTTLGAGVVKAVAWSGETLAASSMEPPYLALSRPGQPVRPVEVSQPGRRLAWLADGSLVLAGAHWRLLRWEDPWRGDSPQEMLPDAVLADLEPSSTGGALALDRDGRIWRLDARGELSAEEARPGVVAVAGAGDLLVLARDEQVDLVRPEGTRSLEARGAGLRDVALSPDGGLLAAGGLDGRLRVWDAVTGELLLSGAGHTERISALAFSRKGDWLVTGSWDHSARLWDLRPARAPREALVAEVETAWGALTDTQDQER